jgi:hypothetical protein
MKRIYISGPMTGLPKFNAPAFHAEAARLRALGHEVINPAELNFDPATSWQDCMRNDLKALLDCDTIAVLDGWQQSKGAALEVDIAHKLGIRILHHSDIK